MRFRAERSGPQFDPCNYFAPQRAVALTQASNGTGGSDLLRPPLNRRERIERCVHSNKSMDLQQAANGGGGNAPQSLRVRFATIQWLP